MKSIQCLALVMAFAPAAAAQSEGPWTLKDCTDYAIEHNISVQQSSITASQREIDLNTAQGRRLPGVAFSASENFSFGRGLTADNTYTNSNTSSTSFSLGADIPIFQGFEISNGIKTARLDLEASLTDLEKAKDDIRVNVAQAYVQILYSQQLLEVAERQVQHDSLLYEQMNVRYLSGKASKADLAAQKATLSQSKVSLIQAESDLQLAKLDLTQLLELPGPEGFEIVAPSVEALQKQILLSPEEIYLCALDIKPAVKSAELALQSAEIDISTAKGGYLPSLSLSGGIGTNFYTSSDRQYSTFREQLKNNFSQYIGLSLNIPIFSRFSTRNQVRTAELNCRNTRLSLENVKKNLYKEIQQAYYNALTAQSQMDGGYDSAVSAREHYELVEEQYMNGKAGIAEYNDAKNSWLQAESDYLRARYQCLFQTRLLDFYRGEEIVF